LPVSASPSGSKGPGIAQSWGTVTLSQAVSSKSVCSAPGGLPRVNLQESVNRVVDRASPAVPVATEAASRKRPIRICRLVIFLSPPASLYRDVHLDDDGILQEMWFNRRPANENRELACVVRPRGDLESARLERGFLSVCPCHPARPNQGLCLFTLATQRVRIGL